MSHDRITAVSRTPKRGELWTFRDMMSDEVREGVIISVQMKSIPLTIKPWTPVNRHFIKYAVRETGELIESEFSIVAKEEI